MQLIRPAQSTHNMSPRLLPKRLFAARKAFFKPRKACTSGIWAGLIQQGANLGL